LKIAVLGAGYVGLSTAVCMATKFPTVAVDLDETRVSQLQKGQVPIHERGMKSFLAKGLSSKRLTFSTRSIDISTADLIFLAVGTPSGRDGSIDLSQVRAACTDIGDAIGKSRSKPTVMVRSTVVPGTARNVVVPLLEEDSKKKCGTGFGVCSNPEFLREGSAIQDTMTPSRIVLGPMDELSRRAGLSVYSRFYGHDMPPIVVTTPEGAELIKYGSNSFLAAKVSMINLLARVSEKFAGTDINDIAKGIGLDPRIGHLFLQAGPGFGGSCFPKDVRAFARSLHDMGIESSMLESILRINEIQPEHVVNLAEKKAGPLAGKRVAVLGLAFKAETGDVRESRSIPVIKRLLEKKAEVRVYDPVAMPNAKPELDSSVTYSTSARDCITGADLAVVMTAWRQFKSLKPSDYAKLMRRPNLIDARRLYDPRAYSRALSYSAIGRADTKAS